MASSTMTGDRRWPPQRRGGMTVLGKVAVPKPVNLPSQRSENHGLDPNVEIVPKGTLSWGSRTSSSPKAWASHASLSPNTDGSAGSTLVNGRPSSGGSGTRPSTSGSDKSLESASNAWGPSSRPSSASGVLASNQASRVAARPRSAEPRPGSSQLSRFAETLTENSAPPWAAAGTAEKLPAASSKINVFSLSSGDFPSLGAEKFSELQPQKGHSSHGRPSSASGGRGTQKEMIEAADTGNGSHGRPSSASSGLARQEMLEVLKTEDESSHANTERGTVDTWRRDNPQSVGGETLPNVEKWQRDPQKTLLYPHSNMPPHQFDPWRGHPVRNPMEAGWYRAPPQHGPYTPPGMPGSYPPVEPFPFYPAQPIPRPGGPGVFCPKNGETFRPHMPDSRVVPNLPVVPVRPGGYPSPMPYDGYYGPPRGGFSNPNERDAQFMGIGPRPSAYNHYPNQNPGTFHAKPGGCILTVDKETGHAKESPQGAYKVLLKHHDSWGGDDADDKKEDLVQSVPGSSVRGDDLGCGKNEQMEISESASGEKDSSQSSSHRREQNKGFIKDKSADDALVKNSEKAANLQCTQHHSVSKKDATLIEKVESLNTKARKRDVRYDAGVRSAREDTLKEIRNVSMKADHSKEVSSSGVNNSFSKEVDSSNGDKSTESRNSEMSVSKPSEPHTYVSGSLNSLEFGEKAHTHLHRSDHGAQDSQSSQRVPEKQELHHVGKDGGESSMSTSMDSGDLKAQVGMSIILSFIEMRAKMREIAIPRAKQLQKEEEERTREQKAKALAKLEELNKRKMVESSKSDQPSIGAIVQHKDEESADSAVLDNSFHGPALAHSSSLNSTGTAAQMGGTVESSVASTNLPPGTVDGSHENSMVSHMAVKKVGAMSQKLHSQLLESGDPKQKQMGYKRKQIISLEKNVGDKNLENVGEKVSHTMGRIGGLNDNGASSTVNVLAVDCVPVNPTETKVPVMQHKKKHNRSVKNKHRSDEVSSGAESQLSPAIETSLKKLTIQSSTLESSEMVAQAVEVPAQMSKEPTVIGDVFGVSSAYQNRSPHSEAHGRVSSKWKSQAERKMTWNPKSVRVRDKFHASEAVWAPVRPINKAESPEESVQISTGDITEQSLGKNGHSLQSDVRNKRAEMERYVPKPVVAKEWSQQGNPILAKELSQKDISQQPLPPVMHSKSNKTNVATDMSTVNCETIVINGPVSKAGFAAETKNGQNGETSKHHRHERGPGSWHQRGHTEQNSVPRNSNEGTSPSDTSNNVQKIVDQSQLPKHEFQSLQHQPEYYNNWNEDVSMPSEPVSSPIIVKDHNTSGRGKRHPYKGHRGQYHAPSASKDNQSEPSDRVIEDLSVNEQIRPNWQPKPRASPNHHRQRAVPLLGTDQPPPFTEMNNDAPAPSESQKTWVADVPNSSYQDTRREAKRHTEEARPQMQDLSTVSEPQHDQPVTSGVRRRGQHGVRFNRGQEDRPYRGRREMGQDISDKQSARYVYQPVGSYNNNNNKPNESVQLSSAPGDEDREATRPAAPRNRNRGQRDGGSGGHFYGRNSGRLLPKMVLPI
ncbi:Protein MODIFIER OF SNC1 1 [Acorus calamus]|uniref:Protein MODIFIER OF SNC1 1 n=1 Tax=Acorus calamus TaxID=4465 RepID=A0AAV9FM07_ACOCL|nr:Protein MODIFIER OF SNC1 1 [Acorus calamus]